MRREVASTRRCLICLILSKWDVLSDTLTPTHVPKLTYPKSAIIPLQGLSVGVLNSPSPQNNEPNTKCWAILNRTLPGSFVKLGELEICWRAGALYMALYIPNMISFPHEDSSSQSLHISTSVSHNMGVQNTKERFSNRMYWLNLRKFSMQLWRNIQHSGLKT
jgi:hypothetical protein